MATVVHTKSIRFVDEDVIEIKLSSLTAGVDVALSHGGPSGARPDDVRCIVVTAPTDGSDLRFVYKQDSDDTANSKITVNFGSSPGGSLDGAVVLLHVTFLQAASGGFSIV